MISFVLAVVVGGAEPGAAAPMTTVHVDSPVELGFFQLQDETKEVQDEALLDVITTHRQGKPMCVAPCTVDVPRDAKYFFAGRDIPMSKPFTLGDRAEVNVRVKPANMTWRSVSKASGVGALLLVGIGSLGVIDGILTERPAPLAIGAVGAALGVALGVLAIYAWWVLGVTRVEVE